MGFTKSKIYLLTITDWNHQGETKLTVTQSIPHVMEFAEVCPYDSPEAFFENWERV